MLASDITSDGSTTHTDILIENEKSEDQVVNGENHSKHIDIPKYPDTDPPRFEPHMEYGYSAPMTQAGSISMLLHPLTETPVVFPEWTIENVVDYLTEEGTRRKLIKRPILYVVSSDRSNRLLGYLSVYKVVTMDKTKLVSMVMDPIECFVDVRNSRKEFILTMLENPLLCAPVIKEQLGDYFLLGYVTANDSLKALEMERKNENQRATAVQPLEKSYVDSTVWDLYKKRVIWLVVLLGVNLMSAAVVGSFEPLLSRIIELAFFIPLVLATGGNTGAQSATLVTTALSSKDISFKNLPKVLVRELILGVCLGVTVAALGWLVAYLKDGATVSYIVIITIFGIVNIANFIGVLLPFVATLIKVDPAVASSPFLTSLLDVIGIAFFFGICKGFYGF